MKWWVVAIILSLAWFFLATKLSSYHTEVILGGQVTAKESEQITRRYTQFAVWGLLLIWLLADCIRRWKPRVGKRTDEELLKLASRAKRNLFGLAFLAGIVGGPLVLLGGVSSAPLAPALVLFIVAWWILGVAAKRGDSRAPTIAVVFWLLLLFIGFLWEGIAVASAAPSTAYRGGPPLLPALLVIAFTNGRSIILELERRDLWHKAFSPVRRTGGLCAAGSVCLFLSVVSLFGGVACCGFVAGHQRAAKIRVADTFLEILSGDEREILAAMNELGESGSDADYEAALNQVNRLEERVKVAWSESEDHQDLRLILSKYGNALRLWKRGLVAADSADSDPAEAQRLIESGNQLRADAVREFRRWLAAQDAQRTM